MLLPRFFLIILSGVRLSPLGTTATTGLLYQTQTIDDGDCGAIGGTKIGRGNRSTRKILVPAPLCLPQIPHDLTPDSNPDRRGWKPATYRLRYGTAPSSGDAGQRRFLLRAEQIHALHSTKQL
jgi:hypothetical protein